MKTARSWPPALLVALLTATPVAAAPLAVTQDEAGTATPPAPVKSGTPGPPTPAKSPSAPTTAGAQPGARPATTAKPSPQTAAAAKPGAQPATTAKPSAPTTAAAKPGAQPTTTAAAKPGAQPTTTAAAKPGAQATPAAKPGAATAAGAKPGTPAPVAAKPGTPAPVAAKPATATQPAAGPLKGAATPVPPPAGAAGAASADPATNHLTLAQATLGIKGLGTLFATIEIAAPNQPVQALHCELYSDQAPLTVANFVGLARGLRPWKDPKLGQWVKRPLYDGNLLHRVVPELLIQGGDPSCSVDAGCRGAAGLGDPGYSVADEIRPELRFDRGGRLAMSNRGPGTAGSQFFITEREAAWLTGGHTIFGQCDGAELLSQLSHVEAGSRDQPKVPLTIKRVSFLRKVK